MKSNSKLIPVFGVVSALSSPSSLHAEDGPITCEWVDGRSLVMDVKNCGPSNLQICTGEAKCSYETDVEVPRSRKGGSGKGGSRIERKKITFQSPVYCEYNRNTSISSKGGGGCDATKCANYESERLSVNDDSTSEFEELGSESVNGSNEQ